MPIIPSVETNRIAQQEFKDLSYEVMREIFAIHNDFGRLFDESVYKKELSARMPEVSLEVAVDLHHGTFHKRLYADAIASSSGLFEFKVADAIHPKHRSQTMQYLLLFDLAHGKLVNMRTEQVQHEFVNCHQRLTDLREFEVDTERYDFSSVAAGSVYERLVQLLRDWGTGLRIELYEEALLHSLGRDVPFNSTVGVVGTSGRLGEQRVSLAAPTVAFKLTALPDREDAFQTHATRLIHHTELEAIQWVNIRNGQVTFRTIR